MTGHRYRELMAELDLPATFSSLVESGYCPLAERLAQQRAVRARPLVVGLCGAQGTGKSTMARFLHALLRDRHGLNSAVLSLDDLYLPREQRARLATEVHPLLRTRGVPGTHEVELGLSLLHRLTEPTPGAAPLRIPRFDKAADTRLPPGQWHTFEGVADIVIFEGWCVGARPQSAEELVTPQNRLEREQDHDGRWRRYVNARLAAEYRGLFDLLDVLVMLKAPSFERVFEWRALQEEKLRASLQRERGSSPARRAMTQHELRDFMMHYERLTRHMLANMPAHADAVLELDDQHRLKSLTV